MLKENHHASQAQFPYNYHKLKHLQLLYGQEGKNDKTPDQPTFGQLLLTPGWE